MNQLVVVTTLVLGMLGSVAGQPTTDLRLEQEIKALERELRDATARRDGAVLDRILSEDFLFIHSTGGTETKKEFIENAMAGDLATQRSLFEASEERIRTYDGKTAIRYAVSVERDKATNSIVGRMRNVAVYVNNGGAWRWVSGQSTPLPLRPHVAAIDPAVYVQYVGRYDIDGSRVLTVTIEDRQLRGQSNWQTQARAAAEIRH